MGDVIRIGTEHSTTNTINVYSDEERRLIRNIIQDLSKNSGSVGVGSKFTSSYELTGIDGHVTSRVTYSSSSSSSSQPLLVRSTLYSNEKNATYRYFCGDYYTKYPLPPIDTTTSKFPVYAFVAGYYVRLELDFFCSCLLVRETDDRIICYRYPTVYCTWTDFVLPKGTPVFRAGVLYGIVGEKNHVERQPVFVAGAECFSVTTFPHQTWRVQVKGIRESSSQTPTIYELPRKKGTEKYHCLFIDAYNNTYEITVREYDINNRQTKISSSTARFPSCLSTVRIATLSV